MPARLHSSVSPRWFRSRAVTVVAVSAVALSATAAVTFVAAPHAARAMAAAATGTGGEFVSLQGRILDTRVAYAIGGYNTPMPAGTWRSVPVEGQVGIPSSGVSAVAVNFTVLSPAVGGLIHADKDEATPNNTVTYMNYVSGSPQSNTATLAIGSDGKIQAEATSSTDMLIDVQGYYTSGSTAAGGYVPVAPTRLVDTRNGTGLPMAQLTGGSTTSIPVTGHAGVPSGASGVMVNFTVINGSSGWHYFTDWDPDTAKPSTSVDFPGGSAPDGVGAEIGLSTSNTPTGAFNFFVSGAGTQINLIVDVLGYFTANTTGGAFTPATARVYDSRISPHTAIAAGATATIQIAGVAGVPVAGDGISAVTTNTAIIDSAGTAAGYARMWADGTTEPSTSSLDFSGGGTFGNMVASALGSDGAVKVHNLSTDAVNIVIDVEGWYSNDGTAISSGQNQTQQSIALQAATTGGGPWVTYKYALGTTTSPSGFTTVPVANVADSNGNAPASWPVTTSGGAFTAYTWNIRNTLIAATGAAPDSLVQVEACYGATSTDPNPVCGMPSNVQFAQSAFGDGSATEGVGPGTVSLLTGDYEVSADDVNVASYQGELAIGRTATSLNPAAATTTAAGVFGPGWTANLSGPDAGDAALAVNDQTAAGYLEFTDVDGSPSVYQATSPLTSYPISFVGVGDTAADGTVVSKVSASTITMTDSDGTVTTWTKPSSGPWQATSVQGAASSSTSTFSFNAAGLVTQMLAPVPAGVTCTSPATTPGCRSLTLAYTAVGSATRLASVSLVAYDPVAGAMSTTELEDYSYDSSGRLSAAWDYRITPNLKTTYTYNSNNSLATVTPPGLATWSFGYDPTGRVSTVSRPDAANSATATSTVVYGVPFTGTGAPVEMGASTTGTWDETGDLPATATAVFDPNRIPAGTTPAAVSSSDWPYATLHYLDANGSEVNTANYGAGAWQITTAQFDTNGNDIWDLTAGNRAQALAPTSSTDPTVAGTSASYARANLLASTTVFDPLNPSDDTDDFGPMHPITLLSGSTVDADDHTNTTYDEGSPAGAFYGLSTTTIRSAYTPDGVDHDPVTTRTGYAALVSGDTSGWSLNQPTTTTVQMGTSPSSADLVTATRYNTAGQVTETRLAGAATDGSNNATDARTTVTRYYTAGTSGTCVSNALAGLPCSVGPAVQPTTGNQLAVTTFTYNKYNNLLTRVETAGSTVRTTSLTYDAGDRPSTKTTAVTPSAAGGTAVPAVTYGYDSGTGLPTTTSTGTGGSTITLTTGYDTLGRTTSYTDAAGITSTTTYDLDGRAVSSYDGQLTTTYTYDSSTEHRGLVTSENIGVSGAPSTFGAGYDPDGNLATETYPSGLTAATAYDNGGNATALTYAQSGSTWMSFTASLDDQDRAVTQSSPQSSQNFTFDADDRLTTVQDTYSSVCTTRTYTFDADSNRTSLKSYPAGTGGVCTTTTTPTSTSSTYDQADRLTNTGYTYDTLGRTTSLPAVDAQGIGAHSSTTGALSVDFYANDMVHGQQQGGAALTYNLDPSQTRIASFSDGTASTYNHFANITDDPTWSSSGSSWTDNVHGPNGQLSATSSQAGTVTLELPNLHGDIVATAADSASATGVSTYGEDTEYGAPRAPSTAPTTYGWVGISQRSTNDLGGLTLMGVRLYDPATGRFASTDPIPGGNANAYVYPDDPISNYDISGEWSHKWNLSRKGTYGFVNALEEGEGVAEIIEAFCPAIPWVGDALEVILDLAGIGTDYVVNKTKANLGKTGVLMELRIWHPHWWAPWFDVKFTVTHIGRHIPWGKYE